MCLRNNVAMPSIDANLPKRWIASRSCNRRPWAVRCLPVATIGSKPLEEDLVSPLAGEEKVTRGVAVLAKAVLDEHSL